MRALWKDDIAEFHGDLINFGPVFCRPQPINKTIPIIVGGHSKAAAIRAGRIGDGFFPARDPDQNPGQTPGQKIVPKPRRQPTRSTTRYRVLLTSIPKK